MKIINKSIHKTILVLLMFLGVISCADLTETNEDPNRADANDIAAEFVMTGIITNTVHSYPQYGYREVQGAVVQFLQRDFIEADEANLFGWDNMSYGQINPILNNVDYLINRAETELDSDFLTGVSLVMKAFWEGFATTAYGDFPYSEARQGDDGVFKPAYDEQREVFKGILEDLETANNLLAVATVGANTQGADPMFGGDPMKWRQFANSMQLRILLRLSEKTADMSAIGVDVEAKFSAIATNSGKYPLMLSSADNASNEYPGLNANDSFQGGNFRWGNRSEFYRRKPCGTIVNALRDSWDPRLTVWFRPVDVQIVQDAGAAGGDEIRFDAQGETKRYVSDITGLDTEMYVGMPPALPNPDAWNLNDAVVTSKIRNDFKPEIYGSEGSNPHTSYLADMYQENTHPLVKSVLMTSADVHFILAEAALRGWIGDDPVNHYKAGILASFDEYAIADGENKVYDLDTQEIVAFDLNAFMATAVEDYNNASDKMEPILTQRWKANFMNIDAWFPWRRTGLPNLGVNLVSGPFGEKMPVRFGYDNTSKILNTENVDTAIGRLSPTVDDHWSKTWLNQGTDKPW